MDGVVPDTDDNSSVSAQDIYLLHEEFALYLFSKFADHISAIQNKIYEYNNLVKEKEEAYKQYKSKHNPSLFSLKGYIQWQGLDSQELLLDNMEAGKQKQ